MKGLRFRSVCAFANVAASNGHRTNSFLHVNPVDNYHGVDFVHKVCFVPFAVELTQGVMMLHWTTLSSPIGDLMLIKSGKGIVRVAFECEDFATVRRDVANSLNDEMVEDSKELFEAVDQIEEYFVGQRKTFDLALDWSLISGFYARAAQQLTMVPFGTTLPYSGLALLAGNKKAHRAAASACSHNPLPILAPCHRITRKDGSYGDYAGGREAKEYLLTFEKEIDAKTYVPQPVLRPRYVGIPAPASD